jgi:four helix bundle protein
MFSLAVRDHGGRMLTIERFEESKAWQDARELVRFIYRITRQEPFRSDWGLRSKIQRAAVSAMSNIAEGFERGSNKEFVQFLYQAKGSVGEVRSQLYVAQDAEYIGEPDLAEGLRLCVKTSTKVSNFIDFLKDSELKGHKFHESVGEYNV